MKYFTLNELIFSATAAAACVPNVPDVNALSNLSNLVSRVLDPAREALGFPISVNSGYRSPRLNALVGGVSTSQHIYGNAADITCATAKQLQTLYAYIADNLTFDQLIYYVNRNFIHVSYVTHRHNREQIIVKL